MEKQKKITQYDYNKAGKVFDSHIKESDYRLKPDEYIVVHLDGVKFTSNYYKKMTEKNRKTVVGLLVKVAKELCNTFNSIRISYVCSDEVSLVLDGKEKLYGNRINKILSIFSSRLTLAFYKELTKIENDSFKELRENCFFAAKAYNIPNESIKDYLNWRLLGCKKLIFDKKQDYESKDDWEKYGFLITKNEDEVWIEKSFDFKNEIIEF